MVAIRTFFSLLSLAFVARGAAVSKAGRQLSCTDQDVTTILDGYYDQSTLPRVDNVIGYLISYFETPREFPYTVTIPPKDSPAFKADGPVQLLNNGGFFIEFVSWPEALDLVSFRAVPEGTPNPDGETITFTANKFDGTNSTATVKIQPEQWGSITFTDLFKDIDVEDFQAFSRLDGVWENPDFHVWFDDIRVKTRCDVRE